MKTSHRIVIAALIVCGGLVSAADKVLSRTASSNRVEYLAGGQARIPSAYRTWTFVTSGLDMSYREDAGTDEHEFTNVFVDPDSMRAFQSTGRWPDGTVIVKEDREGITRGSINKAGRFQSTKVFGVELHIKDSARFQGGWGFYVSSGVADPATLMPASASCYSCHTAHAAVDTTFVQFYPTLIDIANTKGTLSAQYVRESKQGN